MGKDLMDTLRKEVKKSVREECPYPERRAKGFYCSDGAIARPSALPGLPTYCIAFPFRFCFQNGSSALR